MSTQPSNMCPVEVPFARIERALIEEFLDAAGYDDKAIKALDEQERHELLCEASRYASGKLAETELRAEYVARIHQKDGSA